MSWAAKTYWVRTGEQGALDYAITSDMDPDELLSLLDLDYQQTLLVPAHQTQPCQSCPSQAACMDSVWLDGKRMAGPLVGDASFSEVWDCTYCSTPCLLLFRRGPENPVPKTCPRKSGKFGACDGCQRFRSGLAEKADSSVEDKVLAHSILAAVLGDPTLGPAYEGLAEEVRGEHVRHLVMVLCWVLHKSPEVPDLVRALVLEIADGPLGKAWTSKSAAERRFAIRVWEGIVRDACRR